MQSSVQSTRYRFGDLTLDVGLRCVARDGHVLHLGKLTYEMLAALVEAAPNVVTQDELVQRVWGGRIATPETLTQRAKLLRLALGEDTDRPRYVQVVRGQGYRLIPPVERESEITSRAISEIRNGQSPARPTAHAPADMQGSPPSDARPARRPQRFLAAGAIVVAVGIVAAVWIVRDQGGAASRATAKSIAVLPFTDMSEGRNQQFIADGIADEILDRLTRNPGQLRVIARTSSFSFRDRAVDVPEIAAKLDVTHVLEGSVRRSGDRVRITVQLVDGADSSHVWSATYDRTLGELFAVQDDIAGSIADALQVALDSKSARVRTSVSGESIENYLQGKFLYDRRSPGDIERAVKYFESAVARDPGYAAAWASLSGAYGLMWWHVGLDPAVWRPRQGEAARKAVELNPELHEARARLGQYYLDVSNSKAAIEQFRAAARLDPDDPWLASFARGRIPWHTVELEQEIRLERKAIQSDPLSPVRRQNFGVLLFGAGHLDEAMSEFQRMLELNPDAGWDSVLEIGRIFVAQRRYDEAQASFMRLPTEARDYGLALLHQSPGLRVEADAALSRLKTRSGDLMHGIRVAEALALRGKKDDAFATLLQTMDALERDESILSRLWNFQREMRLSPFLGPLHGDARWNKLMAMPEGDSAQAIIEELWPGAKVASVRG